MNCVKREIKKLIVVKMICKCCNKDEVYLLNISKSNTNYYKCKSCSATYELFDGLNYDTVYNSQLMKEINR